MRRYLLRVWWTWAPGWRVYGVYRSDDEAQAIAATCCEEAAAYSVEEAP